MTQLKFESESTLTDRFQTTVPSSVRNALQLSRRDKIKYVIQADGTVLLKKADLEEDPVTESFLIFLAEDMQLHPQKINILSEDLRSQMNELVSDIDVDLNAPLEDEGL